MKPTTELFREMLWSASPYEIVSALYRAAEIENESPHDRAVLAQAVMNLDEEVRDARV